MANRISSVLLPSHLKPIHYKIFLEPDLENFVFSGNEEIEFESSKKIFDISLHSAEIEVLSADIVGKNSQVASRISYNDKAETVTFSFKKPIPKGKIKNCICRNPKRQDARVL